MSDKLSRRKMLNRSGQALAGLIGAQLTGACSVRRAARPVSPGVLIGEPTAERVGKQVFKEGGNAVDAIVAGALAACVAAPWRCGMGGYGGHATLVNAGKTEVFSIDFNTTAPAAAAADMYTVDANGEVVGDANKYGWLALGVPGTLAGLQMLLERFGTRSFADIVRPAIQIAREGFAIDAKTALAMEGAVARLRADPGSARLYLRNGKPLVAGERLRNPDLARLLSALAERNSVKPFYEGDIAAAIAEAVQKNGGLLTTGDFAAYKAREVKPLRLEVSNCVIHTAPLTAGGLTTLEALHVLRPLADIADGNSDSAIHARLEALRLAWRDRLELLGDPEKVEVPVEKLLSDAWAAQLSRQVQSALKAGKPLALPVKAEHQGGTVSLSAGDREGNLVALTLTHGGDFGAQVTVEGLGLTLGHGMSRFDPRPARPNSPGPGKRPLHNMCPTIVSRGGRPLLAVGGAGGVRIPNALFCFLEQYVLRERSLEESIATPRFHTTGTLETILEPTWPAASMSYLGQLGFEVKNGVSARLSAVEYDGGICKPAFR